MVNTKTIILGAAVLALAAPRPALSPEFAPRFAPEIDLPDLPGLPDFSSWWEKDDKYGVGESGGDMPGNIVSDPDVPDVVVSGDDDYGD